MSVAVAERGDNETNGVVWREDLAAVGAFRRIDLLPEFCSLLFAVGGNI
jgi:hypothetical protein